MFEIVEIGVAEGYLTKSLNMSVLHLFVGNTFNLKTVEGHMSRRAENIGVRTHYNH